MNGLRPRLWCRLAVLFLAIALDTSYLSQAGDSTNALNTPRHDEGGREERAYPKSPVDFFRELLAMTPDERGEYLARHSPEKRKRIEAKLEEYTSLRPDERELRLQATELHWYLYPLLNMSLTNRAERLGKIPPDMRKLVEARLQIWEILPPPLTQELVENEQVARIFAQSQQVTPEQLEKILAGIPPWRRKELEAGIARWQAMSDDQRKRLCQQFNTFFDLSPEEKEKALNSLSDVERRQMDKTLAEFEKLPKEQREICVHYFQKFTDMSLPERALFLRNAELWKAMSPAERQAWRDLVSQVPNWPPLPMGALDAPPTGGKVN
jgi:hypothetical protein